MASKEEPLMTRTLCVLIAVVLATVGSMAAGSDTKADGAKDAKTMVLFNGEDLEGWHMHLKDGEGDPKEVWKVRDGAMWCKGEPFGYIRTEKEYEDFRLVLEWQWPEKPSNSGVLLRMTGEDKVWPLSMEAQLKYRSAGDVVGMGCDFNENTSPEGEFFRFARRKNPSNETKPGGWNTYEIVCKGDTMELTVNGLLQNKATGVCVSRGFVGLQSEGSPIMFRNIKLTPLD